jgi:hypothetical protein
MKLRALGLAAALGLGAGIWLVPQVLAQPQWDMVKVNLPYTVTVGEKTIPPGDYTIEQLHSDGSKVLLFYDGKGMKFETSAMTIPAVGNTDETPEHTTVSLRHIGDDYYIDKIFIQGKDYGYQIPLPDRIKAREKEMTSVSVAANSSTSSTSTVTTTNTTPPPPPPVADTTPAPAPVPPPAPTPAPVVTTPPPAPEPQAAPDTTPAPPAPVVSDEGSANREKRSNDDNAPAMPATSAGWLAMLLSGGTLSGAGMMLRRKR